MLGIDPPLTVSVSVQVVEPLAPVQAVGAVRAPSPAPHKVKVTVPAGTTAPKGGPGVGKLGTTAAAHGVRVVTYHGMPLYRYAPDSGTSTQGQGIGGIWFVVHPSSAATTTPTTAKAPSSGY